MRVCPFCGGFNGDQAGYCEQCGKALEQRDEGHPEYANTLEAAAEKVRAASAERAETDRRISPVWLVIVLLPIMSVSVAYLVPMFYVLANHSSEFIHIRWMLRIGAPVAAMVFAVALGYLTYLLLSRINKHTEREERVRAGMISYLRLASARSGEERAILDGLLQLSSYNGQARVYEKKLDAGSWSFMVIILLWINAIPALIIGLMWLVTNDYYVQLPFQIIIAMLSTFATISVIIVLAYIASHLMRTIYTHDLRWTAFVNSLHPAMGIVGKELRLAEMSPRVKEKSSVLYAILSIVTLGLFTVYWLYILIRDPNDHFEAHELIDPAITDAIR